MKGSIRQLTGRKIKALRTKANLTQEELANLADIDYKYFQRIEGKNPPNIKIDTIGAIAKALKTTPNKLLDF